MQMKQPNIPLTGVTPESFRNRDESQGMVPLNPAANMQSTFDMPPHLTTDDVHLAKIVSAKSVKYYGYTAGGMRRMVRTRSDNPNYHGNLYQDVAVARTYDPKFNNGEDVGDIRPRPHETAQWLQFKGDISRIEPVRRPAMIKWDALKPLYDFFLDYGAAGKHQYAPGSIFWDEMLEDDDYWENTYKGDIDIDELIDQGVVNVFQQKGHWHIHSVLDHFPWEEYDAHSTKAGSFNLRPLTMDGNKFSRLGEIVRVVGEYYHHVHEVRRTPCKYRYDGSGGNSRIAMLERELNIEKAKTGQAPLNNAADANKQHNPNKNPQNPPNKTQSGPPTGNK